VKNNSANVIQKISSVKIVFVWCESLWMIKLFWLRYSLLFENLTS